MPLTLTRAGAPPGGGGAPVITDLLDIGDCILNVDASDPDDSGRTTSPINNTEATAWADRSAEENDLAKNGSVAGLTYKSSGWSGSGDEGAYMEGASSGPRSLGVNGWASGSVSQPFTWVLVYKQRSSGSGSHVADGANATDRQRVFQSGANILARGDSSNETLEALNTSAVRVLVIKWDGASTVYWINGVKQSAISPGTDASDGIWLGADYNGANAMDVDIAEAAVFEKGITDTEAESIWNYLNTKWVDNS